MKGRDDINPLQYRLVLLVHMRKRKLRLREMEIIAIAGANEHNRKALVDMLESYRELLFPGMDNKKKNNKDEDAAKKALVDEAKKVYLVKPYDEVTDETWQEMAKKGGDAAFIAHRQLRERQRFRSQMLAKTRNRKK